MPFLHQNYNAAFLENARKGQPPILPDSKYGVRLLPDTTVKEGETYWRVIGIHHLEPLENFSNRNIFMDVLDEEGNRIKSPVIWAGWDWEGRQPNERADPTPLDKPDNETAGNISVGSNQKVSVWIKGRSRASNDPSDRVEGLHTLHPDEVLPDGRKLNTLGHHSFYVVWQRTKKGVGGPIVQPPIEEPGEGPPTPPGEKPPALEQLFTAEERARLREALLILWDKLGGMDDLRPFL